MSNPFLNRAQRASKQPKAYWRSKRQEKDLSKRLSGHRISGSGSGKKKGDVFISRVVRVEAKTTQKASFSITREMIAKIAQAGLASDELPVIVVEFLDEQGKRISEVAVAPVGPLEFLIKEYADATKGTKAGKSGR